MRTVAIAHRELGAYFKTPVGYVIIALFLGFTGVLYFFWGALTGSGFREGQPATMGLFFSVGTLSFLFIAPAISMRTLSEEFRHGTYEMLMTSPVSELQLILGKYLGALGFLLVMLVPTLMYVIALETYGRPDYGELFCGYLGMMLAGSAYLASGILASTLTANQVVAYLLTLFFWIMLVFITKGAPLAGTLLANLSESNSREWIERMVGWTNALGAWLGPADPLARQRDFIIGLIDSFSVVYFVAATTLFLGVAYVSLRVRSLR